MSRRLRHYYECICGSTWSMVFEIGDRQPRTRVCFRCRSSCRPVRTYRIPD